MEVIKALVKSSDGEVANNLTTRAGPFSLMKWFTLGPASWSKLHRTFRDFLARASSLHCNSGNITDTAPNS